MNKAVVRSNIISGNQNEVIILIKIDNPGHNPNFKMLDGDEFSYNGQLFDILTKSVRGITTWYYCIHDKHEERLIAGFEKIQSITSNSGSSGQSKHMLALLFNLITLVLVKDQKQINPPPIAIIFLQYSIATVKTNYPPITPPPKLS